MMYACYRIRVYGMLPNVYTAASLISLGIWNGSFLFFKSKCIFSFRHSDGKAPSYRILIVTIEQEMECMCATLLLIHFIAAHNLSISSHKCTRLWQVRYYHSHHQTSHLTFHFNSPPTITMHAWGFICIYCLSFIHCSLCRGLILTLQNHISCKLLFKLPPYRCTQTYQIN